LAHLAITPSQRMGRGQESYPFRLILYTQKRIRRRKRETIFKFTAIELDMRGVLMEARECAAATPPTQFGSEKVRGKVLNLLSG